MKNGVVIISRKVLKLSGQGSPDKLIDRKTGVVRTINELKLLQENNEIEVEKFAELMEKYSTKLKMIDSAIEKLAKR